MERESGGKRFLLHRRRWNGRKRHPGDGGCRRWRVKKLGQQIKEFGTLTEKSEGLLSILGKLEAQGANKANIERAMYQYLAYKTRKEFVPYNGIFELTPICNLDCKMCYSHLSKQQVEASGHSILSGEQWKQIIDQAVEEGMMLALLTGGEALTHPDFDEIYLHLLRKGISVGVNTNGLLMTPQRIEFFKKYPPRGIQISLYGCDDDSYEAVTGRRVFERVRNAIQLVKEAGLILSIGITPSKYSESFVKNLLKYVVSLDVPYTVNGGLFQPREETGRQGKGHDLDVEGYIRMGKIQAEVLGIELKPGCIEQVSPIEVDNSRQVNGLRCGAGRNSFAITWDGEMHPCIMLRDIVCDLKAVSFAEAWEQMKTAVTEYLVPIECESCEYQPVCTPCVALHAAGAPRGHANPHFCERMRRMVAEGLIHRANRST